MKHDLASSADIKAILRCLYAYFLSLPQEELPYIKIPLHTLIKITPMAYGCHEERYHLPIDAVDTHRPKPARGGKEVTAEAEAPEDSSRAAPARDYFGDLSKIAGASTADTHSANPVEAVQKALQRDADQGLLTPKAVKGL
jgi:6-phosphofructo-2-kinase/fructose-2,6-biphosphatase 2